MIDCRKDLMVKLVYDRSGKGYREYEHNYDNESVYSLKNLNAYVDGSACKWNFLEKSYTKPYYTPLDRNDATLVFESRFECGNLGLAIKISDNEYKLLLQNDSITKGYNQCNLLFKYRVLLQSF
jgi:hypothetical protein